MNTAYRQLHYILAFQSLLTELDSSIELMEPRLMEGIRTQANVSPQQKRMKSRRHMTAITGIIHTCLSDATGT